MSARWPAIIAEWLTYSASDLDTSRSASAIIIPLLKGPLRDKANTLLKPSNTFPASG